MSDVFKSYDIRGIYPEELNEKLAEKIGKAYAAFLKPENVVVGYDMRVHSKPLFDALTKGIISQGANVINIGLCSTPISYFANGRLGVDGSIMITASHNAGNWNGFKLCRANAVPISGATGIKEIEKIVKNESWSDSEQQGKIINKSIYEDYAEHIKSHSKLTRKLKVVADFANSMGSYEIAGLRDLFDIVPMNEKLDGSFPSHEANPLVTETLNDLCAKVKEVGADFGAGFDGDADRCGFVDNEGNIISMDLFTALIAKDILSSGPATILYDLRSSWAVKECIEENGGKAIKCRVGHAFIKSQMRENDAVFAGELSGHYYFKDNYTAESQALAFLILGNLICKSGKTASELVAPLRKYYASGEINSTVKDVSNVLSVIKDEYSDGKMFELDGLSVEFDDWWFNVRSSNTEPLLRLNVEAKTEEKMIDKRDELLKIIRS
ncbi:MAG TPA: phosphomannomutase/phosphoglucomutase [Victivallales bacterium]|nr:phosphomannomutase/phosphoglucomutase [Victivallales bacterium]